MAVVLAYTTVSTVCAAALLGGLVDLDVLDNQVAGIETLGVGIGLSVLEETEDERSGLDWPSGAGDTELLACRILHQYCPAMTITFPYIVVDVPCDARPVPPAYLLIGTASTLF